MKKLLLATFALVFAGSAAIAQSKPAQKKPATKTKTVVIPNKTENPAPKMVTVKKVQDLPGAKPNAAKQPAAAASLVEYNAAQ